ncbi:MAG: 50S ribosomal protein L9 [Saprospiraceae bacterium]|jgi:large subunit ribosomal protein L9|nr:50S ribosomal protein L9 [bacterium]MDB4769286.1 50S ribosomal protein L9 [Saprospiraceae bacterium]MDB4414781.1 50S ribosomal protein L9 [bacterium]MDC3209867.1 50S ribosomal protein L9 [Saprospiraceae bacterium]MDG1434403.1 50S ribosomal protein L9 [Saprospiraceae bacterium]
MDIILLADLDKVGDKHEVVTVKNGYGRNFLIPQGLALIANASNMKKLDDLKAKENAAEAAKVDVYRDIATKLEGKTLKIGAKAGTSGKIFGSVTTIQIIQALKEQFDVEVLRKRVSLEDIKEVGSYTATLNLHPEVVVELPIEVAAE